MSCFLKPLDHYEHSVFPLSFRRQRGTMVRIHSKSLEQGCLECVHNRVVGAHV